jgi:hypothetical protein
MLSGERVWRLHLSRAGAKVPIVLRLHPGNMTLQRRGDDSGQARHPVPIPLPAPDDDLIRREVDVFDAQAGAREEAKTGPVLPATPEVDANGQSYTAFMPIGFLPA